jgi:FKBP-type peptidyl-prolyl cis-trans isomerase SlyD
MAKKTRVALVVCALATSFAAVGAPPSSPQAPPGFVTPPRSVVSDGAIVRLEYTMRDDAGTVLDASADGEPLVFTQGEHQIIPGLERAVAGMGVGEEKRVTVAAEDAYGPVDPDALAEVPRGLIPADAQSAGAQLVARGPDGATRIVRVKELRESTVVLDLNHAFAGMALHFVVRVVGIESRDRPASPDYA